MFHVQVWRASRPAATSETYSFNPKTKSSAVDELFETCLLDGDYRIQVCNTDPRQTIIRTYLNSAGICRIRVVTGETMTRARIV